MPRGGSSLWAIWVWVAQRVWKIVLKNESRLFYLCSFGKWKWWQYFAISLTLAFEKAHVGAQKACSRERKNWAVKPDKKVTFLAPLHHTPSCQIASLHHSCMTQTWACLQPSVFSWCNTNGSYRKCSEGAAPLPVYGLFRYVWPQRVWTFV